MRTLLLLALLVATTLAQSLSINTHSGPHHVMAGMIGDATLDLGTVASPATAYDLTLYPCSGKMNWASFVNDDEPTQQLDWESAALAHGSHIVKTASFTGLSASDVLHAQVTAFDTSFHASYVVAINAADSETPWPTPDNRTITVTDGCSTPGFEGTASVTVTWTGTGDSADTYNVFYHEGATMGEGHIMGTWCGIQALMDTDSESSHAHGASGGVQMATDEFQAIDDGLTGTVCITGLDPNTEYHFDVVVRNAADLHTAYDPVMMISGDADPNGIPITNQMVLNEHAGPFMAMPGEDTYVLLDLATVAATEDEYTVTVYPCEGKMDWYAQQNSEAEELLLDWSVAESEHGVHVIKSHVYEAVEPTDQLWVRVDAFDPEFHGQFVVAVEDGTGSVWPQLPAGSEDITVTHGCDGDDSESSHDHDHDHDHKAHDHDDGDTVSVTVSWTPTDDATHAYNVYYHPGDTMQDGHVMGTWCGIQVMIADHATTSGTHTSGHSTHTSGSTSTEVHSGIEAYSTAFETGISSVCITGLAPETEYHFDVVVRNTADQHTSYHPALVSTGAVESSASVIATSIASIALLVLTLMLF